MTHQWIINACNLFVQAYEHENIVMFVTFCYIVKNLILCHTTGATEIMHLRIDDYYLVIC